MNKTHLFVAGELVGSRVFMSRLTCRAYITGQSELVRKQSMSQIGPVPHWTRTLQRKLTISRVWVAVPINKLLLGMTVDLDKANTRIHSLVGRDSGQ